MNDKILCRNIANAVTKALLYEVSATPKPGLVDRFDNGSHTDMDFFTFIDSACAISPYFEEFARCGLTWDTIDETKLFTIRKLGIDCDKAMFEATSNINTHKGAIFSMSIISACSAYLYKKYGKIKISKLCQSASIIAIPAMKDFELIPYKTSITKGEQLYLNYGITGIRGEVYSGFKSVLDYAMPQIYKLDLPASNINTVLLDTLLSLIANVADTNILARKGKIALAQAQNMAKKYIKLGGYNTDKGKIYLEQMNCEFIKMGISSGGCADLLAVSLALYFIEKI